MKKTGMTIFEVLIAIFLLSSGVSAYWRVLNIGVERSIKIEKNILIQNLLSNFSNQYLMGNYRQADWEAETKRLVQGNLSIQITNCAIEFKITWQGGKHEARRELLWCN